MLSGGGYSISAHCHGNTPCLQPARYASRSCCLGWSNPPESWSGHFISNGLAAFEVMLDDQVTGSLCHGDTLSMADICLVPQVCNARLWNVD